MTLWSGGLTRSRDNLKPLYLHKDSTYGHQTWRYGDLTWGVPSHKVTRFFDDEVLRITWQTEIIVYPPPQCLWPPNSTGWWLAIRSFYLQSRIALESCGLTGPRENLKLLYLHYHNAYGHQTWRDDDLPSGVPGHKVTWPSDHVVLRNHGAN